MHEKGAHTKVLERSYADLENSFFVYSPMLSQQDVIYWLFFSKDVFALDSVIKRIESYHGVRKVDGLIPISIEYHKEVLIKEIERKLIKEKEVFQSKKFLMSLPKRKNSEALARILLWL